MTRRILLTLMFVATVGAAVAGCNSPAATGQPGSSFVPMMSPSTLESAAPSMGPDDSEAPMASASPAN